MFVFSVVNTSRLYKVKEDLFSQGSTDFFCHFYLSASVMASYISYLRIPAMASSAIAVLLSGALYFKQKWVGEANFAPRLTVK